MGKGCPLAFCVHIRNATAREVLRHPAVESCVMVDIDQVSERSFVPLEVVIDSA